MNRILWIFLMCALHGIVDAQHKEVPDKFKNMKMRSIGPAVMSGRVTAIDVVEDNENTIYVGTASGGLWKSESGGVRWKPIFDDQDVIGIGSVCIDPQSPDIIWAGTGEGNPRNSQTSGAGIFRSPDGGRSWKKLGLENSFTIHRIIVDPRNSEVVYAGVHGSAWGPNAERGVFKTTNAGKSWDKILFINDTVGCADLVMDPRNPDKMFAAMYQYQRQPHHFTSGGKGSGLHMTVDGGKTWVRLDEKNGLPEGILGRIGIAIAHSNAKVIYALIESKKTALYKSEDGGFHWNLINDQSVGDRPFYYHEIYVDPSNEHHLIYLHSIVSESIDGGKSWTTMLPYSGVHPDHHAFWWSKTNPDHMIEGNDGGLNYSHDGGDSWIFVNNLPLGQFYHINYDMETPYNVYGGMQDNGSWKGPAYVWHGGGINATDWQEILFGDGFDVVPKPDDSRYAYAMSQGGEVYYVDMNTGSSRFVKPHHPEGAKLRFHWNSGIAQDPFNNCGIYFGSQFLHYSNDCGLNWKIISPDLTTNDSTKLKQNESGGLTPDQTSAENHCTILCIAPSVLNENVIWVGTDDGNIQLTKDGGQTWTNLSPKIQGLPKGSWIPQIVAGIHNNAEAFVVVNNYRQNDWKPYLFHTKDFGQTWENLAAESQVFGHCLSIVQDPIEPSLLFLGTEHGLYVSFNNGQEWLKWTHQYPSVATQDLKIHPREHDLIIGTFGRAAYILDNITPLRQYAASGQKQFEKKLVSLITPTAYQSSYMQSKGERFPGDFHYAGTNRNSGARLGYYLDIPIEKKDENATVDKVNKSKKKSDAIVPEPKSTPEGKKEKDKKVKVAILNLEGDTLRKFTHEPDTGFNFISWNFDTKGVRFPSRKDPKNEDDQPGGGPDVAPGTYKVIYSYREQKDSSTFDVRFDPRLSWDEKEHQKATELTKRFQKTVELAAKGMTELNSAKATIELVATALVNVQDSIKKEVLSQGDSLKKKINELTLLYFLEEGTTGIVDDSEKLNSKLYSANAYLYNDINASNAENAIKYAEIETQKVIDQINSLLETDWLKWRSAVEQITFSLFKDVKRL